MMWLCSNCKIPMLESETEDRQCPTCGLPMQQTIPPAIKNLEFDLMLTALLYGKKP